MDFKPEFQCYCLGGRFDPLDIGLPNGTLAFDPLFDFAMIDGDGDFELKRLTAFVSRPEHLPQTEDTRQIPTGILFNIRDDATGRLLFNSWADTGELFGDGCAQFILPTSHFFRRLGKAQVIYAPADLQGPDFGAATVWLVMVGAKHFRERVAS